MARLSLPPLWDAMLCSVCRRQLPREDSRCRACGTPRGGIDHLDLVLPTGERVPIDRPLQIGRAPTSELRLLDPSVSRTHARIDITAHGASLADAGSSYGTFLDGRRLSSPASLRPGMRIELGDCRIAVAERIDAAAAGHTVSVPAGASLVIDQPVVRRSRMGGQRARRPRLRSGWSLKRLEAAEGEQRYVLKDHSSGAFVRLGAVEADLAQLLDGTRELRELIGEAAERCGPEGPARLARLLAELADRGLLAQVDSEQQERDAGWVERLFRPRERTLPVVPSMIAFAYRRGGFMLFTAPGLALLGAVVLSGLVAFVALIVGRYGTPFVVAQRVGLGALVFVLGRFLIVICHELAHGLTAESFGRPISRAGLKLALVFPYAFVDTTDAWFESRRRRVAISLAGPVSDAVLGGAFALGCWFSPKGSLRDVLFQIALGGYVGALFNLNPLLERDGYHVLVDILREPGLRRRARSKLAARLAGHPEEPGPRRLLLYAAASVCWSAVTVAFAVLLSLRYYHRLASLAPPALVWTLLAAFYVLIAMPLAVTLLAPLWRRRVTDVTPAWP